MLIITGSVRSGTTAATVMLAKYTQMSFIQDPWEPRVTYPTTPWGYFHGKCPDEISDVVNAHNGRMKSYWYESDTPQIQDDAYKLCELYDKHYADQYQGFKCLVRLRMGVFESFWPDAKVLFISREAAGRNMAAIRAGWFPVTGSVPICDKWTDRCLADHFAGEEDSQPMNDIRREYAYGAMLLGMQQRYHQEQCPDGRTVFTEHERLIAEWDLEYPRILHELDLPMMPHNPGHVVLPPRNNTISVREAFELEEATAIVEHWISINYHKVMDDVRGEHHE